MSPFICPHKAKSTGERKQLAEAGRFAVHGEQACGRWKSRGGSVCAAAVRVLPCGGAARAVEVENASRGLLQVNNTARGDNGAEIEWCPRLQVASNRRLVIATNATTRVYSVVQYIHNNHVKENQPTNTVAISVRKNRNNAIMRGGPYQTGAQVVGTTARLMKNRPMNRHMNERCSKQV